MSYFYDDEDEEVNNPFIDNGPQEDEGSTEMPEQSDSGDQGSNGESKLDKVNDAKDKIQKGKELAEKGKKGAQTAKKGADAAKTAKTAVTRRIGFFRPPVILQPSRTTAVSFLSTV